MIRKFIVLMFGFTTSVMACDLKVESAWIREAPSSAASLAGYAVLSNSGTKTLSIVSVAAVGFAKAEMHETLTENGIATMRPLGKLELSAKSKVEFLPAGKHLMLMNPKSPLDRGDMVAVSFKDGTGCQTTAQFTVGASDAKSSEPMDKAKMDQSKMDHSIHH